MYAHAMTCAVLTIGSSIGQRKKVPIPETRTVYSRAVDAAAPPAPAERELRSRFSCVDHRRCVSLHVSYPKLAPVAIAIASPHH
jgi:hypothetical protein